MDSRRDKDNDKDLSSYSEMSNAVEFFLDESFRHLENQLRYQIAGKLFASKLENIDATEEDRIGGDALEKPLETLLDIINYNGNILSDETTTKMAIAWVEAKVEAERTEMKFPLALELRGTSILAHVINFAYVFEVLTNRHLFILNLKGELTDFTFNSLDKASIMSKVLYLFKEEIKDKKLTPDRIANLFRLRNLAVHLTRDNSQRFEVTIQELVEIWKETCVTMQTMAAREGIADNKFWDQLTTLKTDFLERFVLKKKTASEG